MTSKAIRIIFEGATGRLGNAQHLRALLAIRAQGGIALKGGERLTPEPVLLGRNPDKLKTLASAHGLSWSTDSAPLLADKANEIYFDASVTAGRFERAQKAIAAGKHVYLEKPVADSLVHALELASAAQRAGVRHGVVQDKLFLPGLHKMRKVIGSGFLGKILSAKLDFGWWVFDGELYPAQRSSWNYRRCDGGGLVLDMFPHWRYIIDRLLGDIRAVSCRVATLVPQRRDEAGQPYAVDVEDSALATFELAGGALVEVNSSWATRVKRDDMFTLQIDGTQGSVSCGLHRCSVQPLAATPSPQWNIEAERSENFDDQWQLVPDVDAYQNPYRAGWELFLRHVADGAPFPSPLIEGAKGLQLVDGCYRSHAERRWVDLPALSI
ncbi:MAG: Gfo/Idh/MocA family oxidoreductase [Proteobacteria bacterium]|nr:Gfo/Idh/MocA family oxidoreductase [Pseudomonadota bacterium]